MIGTLGYTDLLMGGLNKLRILEKNSWPFHAALFTNKVRETDTTILNTVTE